MSKTLGYYSRFKAIADIWKRLADASHLQQRALHIEMDETRELIKVALEKHQDTLFDIYKDKGFYYASLPDEFSDIKKLKFGNIPVEKALKYVHPEQLDCLFC